MTEPTCTTDTTVAGELSWRELALCREVDPELFFPEKGEPAADAKKVCAGCEVKVACLADALNRREAYGIWGGLSARERTALLRLQRRAAARVGRVA
jgi:WhiB family redox-sensing transcriptional regulator